MDITVHIDEALLVAAAQAAINKAFAHARDWDEGVGAQIITRQVEAFVRSQDYSALIAELAPSVMREVVHNALADAIAREAKRQVKLLAETGKLVLVEGAQ
jgi:hypothetical protein